MADSRRSRSRSPYHAGRDAGAAKRRHDDDHYGRANSDPRRHKSHYEDSKNVKDDRKPRSLKRYDPRDDPRSSQFERYCELSPYQLQQLQQQQQQQQDRSSYRSRSPSRSPYRADRESKGSSHSLTSRRNSRDHDADDSRKRGNAAPSQRELSHQKLKVQSEAKPKSSEPGHDALTVASEEKPSWNAALDETDKPALTEAELTEQRRKRREAIRARHKNEESLLVKVLEPTVQSTTQSDASTPNGDGTSQPNSPAPYPGSPVTSSNAGSPATPPELDVTKVEDLIEPKQTQSTNQDEGPSAADFNPQELEEDRLAYQPRSAALSTGDESRAPAAEKAPKPAKEFDMFADDIDDDDMFAQMDADAPKTRAQNQGLAVDYDLPDGHYRIIRGELIGNHYNVLEQIGKGTFATVVRAIDVQTNTRVAIKIACNNDTMLKAGRKETKFLKTLNEADPDDKKHVIRFHREFMHKNHLCLVFEDLNVDLRALLKKVGRKVGFRLSGLRNYAQQMFMALEHMRKQEILHADLKPDNILVNYEPYNVIKLCDFGTAILQKDVLEPTPFLISRFYRPPEIILGIKYDTAIDMWSIGCTLFELYTDKILFRGATNNGMLREIQNCRGKIPQRMIKKGELAHEYFDDEFAFWGEDQDPVTHNIVRRVVNFKQVSGKDLKTRLAAGVQGGVLGLSQTEAREHAGFADLLDKCLHVDPEKRIKPKDALRHHFFTSQFAPPRVGRQGG